MHVVHYACIVFRMRCLAHRLLEWGFEEQINDLSKEELLILSNMLPEIQSKKIAELAETRPSYAV